MSTAQSTAGGANGAREFGPGEWADSNWRRDGRGWSRWTPFELVAIILGLVVFWPIGVAMLVYKFWQGRHGGDDLQTVATNTWNKVRGAMAGASCSHSRGPSGRGGFGATGNSAFDEWKGAELDRLEAERRKLEDAHREFAEFVDNLRKSKDREEFERFMNARRARQ